MTRCYRCGRVRCEACGGTRMSALTRLGMLDEPCQDCKDGWGEADQCGPYNVSRIVGTDPDVLCPQCEGGHDD